jgi:hypothetical protein
MIFWFIITGAIVVVIIAALAVTLKVRYHGRIAGTPYRYRPYRPQHKERG